MGHEYGADMCDVSRSLAILIALMMMMNGVTIGWVRVHGNGGHSHVSCVKRHNFGILELLTLDSFENGGQAARTMSRKHHH